MFALLVQIYSCVISQFKYTYLKRRAAAENKIMLSIYIKHIKNKYLPAIKIHFCFSFVIFALMLFLQFDFHCMLYGMCLPLMCSHCEYVSILIRFIIYSCMYGCSAVEIIQLTIFFYTLSIRPFNATESSISLHIFLHSVRCLNIVLPKNYCNCIFCNM